ncbi:MAG: hypothetical protein IPN29_08765 [Saprospiraceae bacterium]|nr:hypothetical protein [Saprospiraceae bacterium]
MRILFGFKNFAKINDLGRAAGFDGHIYLNKTAFKSISIVAAYTPMSNLYFTICLYWINWANRPFLEI